MLYALNSKMSEDVLAMWSRKDARWINSPRGQLFDLNKICKVKLDMDIVERLENIDIFPTKWNKYFLYEQPR